MKRIQWLRWLMGAAAVLALGTGLMRLHEPVHAQAPSQPGREARKKIYTNKNTFHLPVKINDSTRSLLKEVCLYVKSGAADWVRQETAPPEVEYFNYHVPQDGEYWFSVTTVDKQGKMTPADVSKQAPGLQVVVDTQPPVLELKPATAPDGEQCLMCTLQDDNPDYQSIQVSYRGADQAEHILEPHATKAGLFRVPELELWGSMVRISAADRCGNKITREMRMPALNGTPATAAAVPTPAPNAPASMPTGSYQPAPPPDHVQVVINQPAQAPQASSTMLEGASPIDQPSKGNLVAAPAPLPKFSAAATVAGPDVQPQKLGAHASPDVAPSSRQLLNTNHASLEYRIDQVGPSGVGRVEVWITGDNGTTWQRLCEDSDRRSPADIDLPGEGLFGLRLVVTNGNGFGASLPKRGDAPSAWIEVDTTPPFVQLRDPEPVTDGGSLEIRWSASDKNLANEPVTLYFRARSEGPWQVIARNLKNDGVYRWAFPHDLGSQFFFRVEVTDQAGNRGRADSAQAVVLDMSEPRAVVMGITGVSARQR